MAPVFLVPETTVTANGSGAAIAIDGAGAGRLLVTLGITAIVEQELLEISIWDSPDGHTWGKQPLAAFPQKFGAGNSALVINLASHPETRFLQVRWNTQRWGRGSHTPHFTFFVFAEDFS